MTETVGEALARDVDPAAERAEQDRLLARLRERVPDRFWPRVTARMEEFRALPDGMAWFGTRYLQWLDTVGPDEAFRGVTAEQPTLDEPLSTDARLSGAEGV